MKKNIFTIVIMALIAVNLILTSIMMFSMLPSIQKTNKMITTVSSILDLEIEAQKKAEGKVSLKDQEVVELAFTSKQTINLKKQSEEEETHYAVIESVSVSLNKKAKDYESVKKLLDANKAQIQDMVKDAICGYSATEISEKVIREDAKVKINDLLETDTIVSVSLGGFLFT